MTSTSLPDSLIATLPGSSYTDPGILAKSRSASSKRCGSAPCVPRTWPSPGAFRTVEVGRESILITRARDNSVRAFFNVCRHRGAKLCTEEAGEVKRAFQCPYHAWTYDLNGKLVAAPNLTKMPDVGRTEFGLVSVTTREWLGYVWVCLAENPPSFEDDVLGEVVGRLGDVESIEHYDIDNLSVGKRIVYDVKANWKLIIENFIDATTAPRSTPNSPRCSPVRRRLRGPVLRRPRRRVRRGGPASPSTAPRGWTAYPACPTTRTAATTRSPSNRRSSSTSSIT